MVRKTKDPDWGLNLDVHACQKKLSHFDIGIHMLLFIQCIKGIFYIYKHHYRFQKTDSDEKKPTVMLVITVGLF